MKRRLLAFILILILQLNLCSCSSPRESSYFRIQFIDVGQGDAALVECDGHFMLIDGGDSSASEKMYNVLKERLRKKQPKLDILAISHLHEDHYAGLLERALPYVQKLDLVISNSDENNNQSFSKFKHQLVSLKATIHVPNVEKKEKYELGSAIVEVVDVSAEKTNDSLVLLITYGKTRFLFTGDIEEAAQTRISNKYQNEKDEPYKINLIKMPHHGSYTRTLNRFLRTFMPDYAIISVGKNNKYEHPHADTISLLNNRVHPIKTYRTDLNGDIIVESNGNTLLF